MKIALFLLVVLLYAVACIMGWEYLDGKDSNEDIGQG